MSRFKIIVFLMAMGVLAAILATAYWFYSRVIAPDAAAASQVTKMHEKGAPPADPGIKRFDKAAELIQDGDLDGGRSALYELVRAFPESSRVSEAKRIIGEINMDMLFSADNPLKKDYIVQPGDSLGLIARKQQTTIECLMRANGMQSGILQPKDHLLVFPLDFKLKVNVAGKTVTLLRNDRFFREYKAVDLKLPVPKAPYEAKISDKPAWVHGRRAGPLTPEFVTADKWLTVEKAGKEKGTPFNIRALPRATATDAVAIAPGDKGKSKAKAKTVPKTVAKKPQKGEALAGTSVDDDEVDVAAAMPTTGIFLAAEDIEELFTIVRAQTPVTVLR